MDSLYSPEVREIILTAPWPKGLEYDVYEQEDTLLLLFYEDNLATLSGDDKERIKLILLERIAKINNTGVPIRPDLAPTRKLNG